MEFKEMERFCLEAGGLEPKTQLKLLYALSEARAALSQTLEAWDFFKLAPNGFDDRICQHEMHLRRIDRARECLNKIESVLG